MCTMCKFATYVYKIFKQTYKILLDFLPWKKLSRSIVGWTVSFTSLPHHWHWTRGLNCHSWTLSTTSHSRFCLTQASTSVEAWSRTFSVFYTSKYHAYSGHSNHNSPFTVKFEPRYCISRDALNGHLKSLMSPSISPNFNSGPICCW